MLKKSDANTYSYYDIETGSIKQGGLISEYKTDVPTTSNESSDSMKEVGSGVVIDDSNTNSNDGEYKPKYTKYWWNDGSVSDENIENDAKLKNLKRLNEIKEYQKQQRWWDDDRNRIRENPIVHYDYDTSIIMGGTAIASNYDNGSQFMEKARIERDNRVAESFRQKRIDENEKNLYEKYRAEYDKFVNIPADQTFQKKSELSIVEKLENDIRMYKDNYIHVQKLRDDARRELTKTVRLNEKLEMDNKILKLKLELLETNPDEYKRRKILDPFNEENWEEM